MNDLPRRRLDRAQSDDTCQRLAAIVDSADDAILSTDLEGLIQTWNPAAQRMLGYSQREAVGQPLTIIIPPELHQPETALLQKLRAGQRIEPFETRRLTRDGRCLDVSLTLSPLTDERGTIVGAAEILRIITESRETRAALQESRQRLAREMAAARALQSISTRLIADPKPESLYGLILDAAMELMGSDAASLQILSADGKTLTLLGSKNFHPESAAFWQRVTMGEGCTCGTALYRRERVLVSDVEACESMAGTPHLLEYRRSRIRAVQSTPLQARVGRPLGMLSTHWSAPHTPTEDDFRLFDVLAQQVADLIERTRAEDAIRESEERFRLIANAAPVVIWMTGVDKRCTYINQQWLNLTGQSFAEAIGTGWMTGMHPEDAAACWEVYASAFDRRERVQVEYRIRRHDGEYRWIVGTGVPRYTGDGSFAGYIGSALDVTERKQAEDALATIHQRLIDAQEEERARIARELHDDVVQRLSLLNIRLHALVHPTRASATDSIIEEASAEVVNLAKDVQALARRLHPARLEYLGIDAAAKTLCRELSAQHGVDIDFQADPVPKGLSRHVAVCLYRVLQEALRNAIKHSRATRIEVSLRCELDLIELTIHDFGVGFNIEMTQGRGLGLNSMEERLQAVQGRLIIRSQPPDGTTIRARVPLARE